VFQNLGIAPRLDRKKVRDRRKHMAGPCDGKKTKWSDLDWRWHECERDLKNNPDHKKIEELELKVVSLTKGISETKDKSEIARLTGDKKATQQEIEKLSPKVRPLAASCESLKKQSDDALKEWKDCEAQHKDDKGGGQTR
jgi:predicted  nucleic acid-binding Zn-ribbon protein